MALDNAKNFAKVTVSTGYDGSATSIVLSSGHGLKLPSVPFNAVWWNTTDYGDPSDDPNVEIVRVTNIATDTLTVTRAQEGTTATTKNEAGRTYKMIAGLTAKGVNTDLNQFNVVAKTGTYTLQSTDYLVNCTSGTFTVTLPSAASNPGKIFIVKNSGIGTITIDTTSSQTIDSVLSIEIYEGDALSVISNGSNWLII